LVRKRDETEVRPERKAEDWLSKEVLVGWPEAGWQRLVSKTGKTGKTSCW